MWPFVKGRHQKCHAWKGEPGARVDAEEPRDPKAERARRREGRAEEVRSLRVRRDQENEGTPDRKERVSGRAE